jgi:hypothetical protein
MFFSIDILPNINDINCMILDSKQIRLEDMAETARKIVEEENADAHESASQPRPDQTKKLRKKSIIPVKKKHQIAKMKGFKKELSNLVR